MQYILLGSGNDPEERMHEFEQEQLMEETSQFVHSIVQSGHYRASARLESPEKGKTVLWSDNRFQIREGSESSRPSVQFCYIVECSDMQEALSIAGRIPLVRLGMEVEIRAVVPGQ